MKKMSLFQNTDAFLEGNDVEGSPRQSAERSDTSVLR